MERARRDWRGKAGVWVLLLLVLVLVVVVVGEGAGVLGR